MIKQPAPVYHFGHAIKACKLIPPETPYKKLYTENEAHLEVIVGGDQEDCIV